MPAVAPDARLLRRAPAALLLALLAACHTIPKNETPPENVSHLPPGNSTRDGPEANPPPNLEAVPDAVPQVEPLRIGGPNKPYEVAGHTYVPLTDDRPVTEKGLASWYGKKFHGHRTASGEAYNMYAMTAAHKTLPIPSYARVRNPANGHEVIVRVNDRGPFSAGRVIDLSYTAALKLGVLGGVQQVEISRITEDDIRTGAAFRRSPTYAGDPPPPGASTQATAVATASTGGPMPMPASLPRPTSIAVGDLDRPAAVTPPGTRPGAFAARRTKASGAQGDGATTLAPSSADVLATAADPSRATAGPGRAVPAAGAVGAGLTGATVDLGAAAAADSAADIAGATTSVTTEVLPAGTRVAADTTTAGPARPASPAAALAAAGTTPGTIASPPTVVSPSVVKIAGTGSPSTATLPPPAGVVLPPLPGEAVPGGAGSSPAPAAAALAATTIVAAAPPPMPARAEPRDEHAHAETTAGAGFWIQLGAFKQRDGALDYQHRLLDEAPWLAPLMAVFTDHGLNKLQAGPYRSRDDARSAAERVRATLQLVPTIVEKR